MNARKKPESGEQEQEQDDSEARVPRSIYIKKAYLERMRAAVFAVAAQHPEEGINSMSDLVEEPIIKRVKQLERKYNNGEPFSEVRGRLR